MTLKQTSNLFFNEASPALAHFHHKKIYRVLDCDLYFNLLYINKNYDL